MQKKYLLIVFLLLSNLCFALTGAKLLIIAPDSFVSTLTPLATWKTKSGIKTKIAPMSVTGTSASSIKSYITNAYNTWDIRPEYLLLAGFGTVVPYSGSSDDYYADISGTYRIELSVGRLPCATVSQCNVLVSKILGYERTPYVDDTMWLKKGTTLVREDSPTDAYYQADCRYVRNFWINAGYAQAESLLSTSGHNSTNVMNAINDGRSYVLYRGQAVTNWWSPFDQVIPNNMTNGFKLPIVVSGTCATMSLSTTGYQGDKFLNAGTSTNPKGSVAYFGTTQTGSSVSLYRGLVTRGFFKAVFNEQKYILGDAAKRGKYYMDSIVSNQTRYNEWQLFGDPSMRVWTGAPKKLVVVHDTVIEALPQTYTVTVSTGVPVSGATVCLMMDTLIYQTALTNSSGVASFTLTPPVGTMSVTITGQKCIPYEKNVRVIPGNLNHDVGVFSIVQPSGTIANGAVVTPKVKVKNYTNNTDTFPVIFRIGTVYNQVYSPVVLAGNDTTTISFPNWTANMGSYITSAYTNSNNDQWHGNDTVYGSLNVVVPNDVGVDAIIKPDSSVPTNTAVLPQVRIKNYGSSVQNNFAVTCSIIGATGLLRYSNTQIISSLGVNDTIRVNFSSWTPTIAESCMMRIRTNLIGDQNPSNDYMTKALRVTMLYFAEGFNGEVFPPTGWQNIVIQGSYGWQRMTSNTNPTCSPYEGAGMASYPTYSASSGSMARLISPAVALGSTPVPCTLKFAMYHDDGYGPVSGYGPDSVKVEYSLNGTTFNRVAAFRRYEPTNGWTEHTVYLGTFSGTIYVGLLAYSQYGNNTNIDYVRLIGTQASIKDVGVDAIIYPQALHLVNNPMIPIARVKNFGNTQQTNFPVVCSIINGSGLLRYTNTQTVYSLNVGDTARVNFLSWTPNTIELCTVKIRTNLTGDQNTSDDRKTRLTQISANAATNIVSPNGNELWAGGSNKIIKWRTTGTGYTRFRILLSRNSGSTYTDTIANNIASTESTYNWTLPMISYNTCRILVQILESGGLIINQDASDNNFTIDAELPSVPALVSPLNNAYLHDTLPRFFWHHATDFYSGVDYYQFQYADNSSFTGGITVNANDTSYQLLSMLTDSIYYWRVKTIDRAGNQGNWSVIWTFEIDSRIPSIPVLMQPVGGVCLNNASVIFTWSLVSFDRQNKGAYQSQKKKEVDAFASPIRYIMQVDTNQNFSIPLLNDTTSFNRDTLILNTGKYYWRVRAYDLAGNHCAFSNLDSFIVDLTAPSIPALIYPADGYFTNNQNVTFTWHHSTDNTSGISGYIFEYAKNTGFINPQDTIIPDTLITLTLTDTVYYWRVKSLDRAGNQSSWSTTRSLEIDTSIPARPILISPINGLWFSNDTVIFSWLPVTFNTESPIHYILQIDTNNVFANPLTDTISLSCDTIILNQDYYYCRVSAYDLAGNHGLFSYVDSFGVDISAPTSPVLSSPADGSNLSDSFVAFVWQHSADNLSGIRHYQIHIAKDSGFVNRIDTIICDTTIIFRLYDTTYWWHVKAIDLAGNASNWSNIRNFRIITTGIVENENSNLPHCNSFYSLSPNPVFSNIVKIAFCLDKKTKVKLHIFDISGKLVRTIVNTNLNQGVHYFSWNRNDFNNRNIKQGIYFICLETPKQKHTQKIVLVTD